MAGAATTLLAGAVRAGAATAGAATAAVWRGMIRVDPGAQQTDAYQESRNLLLSKSAHADAIPGLEIEANDVRCTHAAAVAQIDAEQLHYLRSHGLSEEEAKRLKDAAVKRETKDRVDAQALADEIGNKTVVVRLKMGAEDKAFGSITNQDVATALKAQHRVEIDRHKIDMKEPIKTLGEHQVSLKLHRDVAAHVNVIVTQDR